MVIYPDFLDGPLGPEEGRPLDARWQSVNAERASRTATQQQYLRWSPEGILVKTMRAVLFVLIVAVLLVIAGIATGFLNINQIRGAKAPDIAATPGGVTAKGGQAPAFDVQTGSVKVGTKQKTVNVPTLVVQKPQANQAATNNSM
jgi:hypothetical protein